MTTTPSCTASKPLARPPVGLSNPVIAMMATRSEGEQSAKFVPDLPKAGRYQVAMIYGALGNRAPMSP